MGIWELGTLKEPDVMLCECVRRSSYKQQISWEVKSRTRCITYFGSQHFFFAFHSKGEKSRLRKPTVVFESGRCNLCRWPWGLKPIFILSVHL